MKKGVGGSTADGGAERIGKEKGKKKKKERSGRGKFKTRIGEIEDKKTGKKVHACRRRRKEEAEGGRRRKARGERRE